jgi:hypothetical protein
VGGHLLPPKGQPSAIRHPQPERRASHRFPFQRKSPA